MARQLAQPVNVAPYMLARSLRHVEPPAAALICVYRESNAARVARALRAVPGAEVALWALDSPSELLRERTVGSGAGPRTELLNKLQRVVGSPSGRGSYLVVLEDDVEMRPERLSLYLRACRAARLDIGQPAHLPRSYTSWPFVRQRLLSLMRLTDFVEQGPLVALSERGAERCFPLPEHLGMGWGLEARWTRMARAGLRLGIVDATGMRHVSPISANYDRSAQEAQGRAMLREEGFSSYTELQVTRAQWRVGQPAPDWIAA
jgi:hypothetical protein